MARKRTPWLMAAIVCVSITGCSDDGGTPDGSSATTGSTAGDQPLYVALEWHMHQPRYPVVDDVITRPWVRAHATKDYLDMVTRAADSGVPVTVNVTPSLLLQLEELTTGVDDAYRQHTRVPAEQLTPEQRDFVLAHFFDTNEKIVSRFARYAELASKDHDAFTTDDLRDL